MMNSRRNRTPPPSRARASPPGAPRLAQRSNRFRSAPMSPRILRYDNIPNNELWAPIRARLLTPRVRPNSVPRTPEIRNRPARTFQNNILNTRAAMDRAEARLVRADRRGIRAQQGPQRLTRAEARLVRAGRGLRARSSPSKRRRI